MQVIALSREKIWGKKIVFCTNPPDSTYNLKKIIMAKLYLTQNQQNQRPFSEKEGMWVKREFFTNCKSREKTHFGQFFVFFPLPRAREGWGGTPIHYLYGYVPPKGVVILKLLI